MWDETDYLSRSINGLCALVLAVAAVFFGWYTVHDPLTVWILGGLGLTFASARLCWRCARYAITGKGNINRDNF